MVLGKLVPGIFPSATTGARSCRHPASGLEGQRNTAFGPRGATPLPSFSPSGPMCVQRGEVKSTDSSPTVSVVSLAPLLASCGALGQTWGLNPAESCPTTGLQLENILGTRSGWRAMGSIAFYLRRLFSSHRLRTQVMGFGTRRPH